MKVTTDQTICQWLFCGSAQSGARPTPDQLCAAVLQILKQQ